MRGPADFNTSSLVSPGSLKGPEKESLLGFSPPNPGSCSCWVCLMDKAIRVGFLYISPWPFPCSGVSHHLPGSHTPQTTSPEDLCSSQPCSLIFSHTPRASITRVPFYDLLSARKKKIASKQ